MSTHIDQLVTVVVAAARLARDLDAPSQPARITILELLNSAIGDVPIIYKQGQYSRACICAIVDAALTDDLTELATHLKTLVESHDDVADLLRDVIHARTTALHDNIMQLVQSCLKFAKYARLLSLANEFGDDDPDFPGIYKQIISEYDTFIAGAAKDGSCISVKRRFCAIIANIESVPISNAMQQVFELNKECNERSNTVRERIVIATRGVKERLKIAALHITTDTPAVVPFVKREKH